MEIADLKKQIKSEELDKVYIFHGEEHAVMKVYLNMMAAKKYQLTYVDSLMDLMSGIRTKALIQNPHLYIIVDDKEFLTNEKMWEKFKGLKDDIVVFYYTTTDKRLKFWKHFKDRAVEFKKMDDRILMKYIKQNVPLSDENCQKLIEITDGDYGRILLEIDKMKAYSKAEAITPDGSFETLMKEQVIYVQPQDAIFDFVAAVLERQPAKAYNLLQQSKAIGEANLTLISVLYNNIKILLQVQSAKDYKTLGLNGFVLKNTLPYRNNYTNGELVKALKLLRNIEKGIKTGSMPDDLSIEYFLVQVI